MLDKKDNKILSIIANNSKITKKQLAKKVGLSREVVSYRLNRLESKKIILGYQTRLNLNSFSIMGCNLFLRLKRYDGAEEKKLVDFFKKQPYTHFVAKVGGNYDYMIGFTIKRTKDLENYIEKLYELFGDIVDSHDIFNMLEEIKDNVATVFDPKNKENYISMKEIKDKPVLDATDKKIIKLLADNSRLTSVEIGNGLKMTSAAVSYRIKALEKKEVILGYRGMIDVLAIGKQFYYISFNIDNLSKKTKNKVKRELITNPNIVFANHLSGKYSYVAWLFADGNEEFYNIIQKIQNRVPEIKNLTSYTVLEFLHHNYIPDGFLEE